MLSRRACLKGLGTAAGALALSGRGGAQQIAPPKRLNVLMLVADDMNWDSPGCFGGAAPDITPNVDQLAAEGMRFFQAYNNIAICTPARSVMLSGQYPHNNGVEGFQVLNPGTATLPASLNAAGYFCGIVGKPLRQQELLRWSVTYRWQGTGDENLWGRDPEMYRKFSSTFFEMARTSQQPFFLMASSHDPHPPYDDDDEGHPLAEFLPSSRRYGPEEVRVPGFLPDVPDVREEMAGYCTSTRRLDDMVGAVLEELDAAGFRDDTIVIFLSDNGIALPFAKTTCYPEGTRTPLIVRWPGKVAAGVVDREHMVSAIDLFPTVLDALEMPVPVGVDGASILPLLEGETMEGRDGVYTEFHHVHGRQVYPTRSLITREHAYIFNAWSNGTREYRTGPLGGLTWRAMERMAETDAGVAARVRHYNYRTVEEFYDLRVDPYCLDNLVGGELSDENAGHLVRLREKIREVMVESEDAIVEAFDGRDDPDALEAWMAAYGVKAKAEKEAIKPYEKAQDFRF